MTLRHLSLAIVAAAMTWPIPAAAQPPTATVFFLRQSGSEVTVDSVVLKDGEMKVLPQHEAISLILPYGSVGMSGDVVQKAQRTGMIAILYRGGEIRARIRNADGSERDLPAVKVEDLPALDIRINITGGAGYRKAYVVRSYREVESAPGPVIDMFGGKVPIGDGDFAITTEIRPHAPAPRLDGSAPMEFDDGVLYVWGEIAGAVSGWFIVDVGAGGTALDSRMLPPGTDVRPVRAVEHSDSGTRDVAGIMHGAGGEVAGFLGQAVLPHLRIGSLEFAAARVNVVKEFPAFGRKVAGVLGIDLLGRAAVVSLDFADPHMLRLSSKGSPERAGAVPVPFSVAVKHLFVEGSVDGVPVRLLVDTGARRTLIGREIADKANLRLDHDQVWTARGLDDHRLELPSAVAARLSIGSTELRDQRIHVGELPALRAMGLQNTGGLLGTDVLGRFDRVEVDFTGSVIWFYPRGTHRPN
jgi:hypothetical protein